MIEKDKLVKDDKETAKIFNESFINITKNLNLLEPPWEEAPTNEISENIIKNEALKFWKHPSILKIKERNATTTNAFEFLPATKNEVKKSLLNSI